MAVAHVIAGLQPFSIRRLGWTIYPPALHQHAGRLGGTNRRHKKREQPMSPTEPATRQHASTGPAFQQLPEPTHAERVRTLMSLVPVATLSTLSRKQPEFPFGSLMPFALDSTGRPI